jgi:hypothetical protein
MSATRTFTALTGGGAGNAFQSGDKFGYQTAEKIRQALDIAMYLPTMDLGGEEGTGVVTGAATWVPVPGYRAFTLNGDSVGGLTVQAVVYYKTENASQAVQVRIRNTTDSSTAATGTSSTATTATEEVLTVTLASGAKSYRLEMTGGATYGCAAWGYLRLRVVPS